MNDNNTIQKASQHESELPHYIAEAIQIIGSVRKLASIAGVSERSVYAWKNGERFPSRSNLNKISEYLESLAVKNYHIETPNPLRSLRQCLTKPYQNEREPRSESLISDSVDTEMQGSPLLGKVAEQDYLPQSKIYIANDQDQAPRHSYRNNQGVTPYPHAAFADEFVFIEKAEAKPSAGGGSLETSAKCENTYAFRLDWVLQKTHSSKGLRMMEVAGRSMESTLHNGDLILVDEQDKRLVEDRIYVLRVHDEIYIKRFSKTPGYYHFRGDNRDLAYQDITINLHTEDLDWAIIGRTIWAGKEL